MIELDQITLIYFITDSCKLIYFCIHLHYSGLESFGNDDKSTDFHESWPTESVQHTSENISPDLVTNTNVELFPNETASSELSESRYVMK